MNKLCPCGSNRPYSECCEPIISSQKEAATCEELMRSRYTAFAMANVDYLMHSHHTETRQLKETRNIKKWAASVQWMGLTILNKEAGQATDATGYVEFRAIYLEAGQLQQIHEKSFFKRENQRWVYVSGIQLNKIPIHDFMPIK